MSQRELSLLAGLSSPYVWMVESQKSKGVTLRGAEGLAGVLGCSVEYLARGAGKPPPAARVKRAVAAARAKVAVQATE